MTEINDEVLMAYADGTLDAEVRDAVEARLAESPELRDLVERHVFQPTVVETWSLSESLFGIA